MLSLAVSVLLLLGVGEAVPRDAVAEFAAKALQMAKPYIFPEPSAIANEVETNRSSRNGVYSGDTYLDSAYEECLRKDAFACAKYRALYSLHTIVLQDKIPLTDSLKLVQIPYKDSGKYELSAAPRGVDSEMDQFFKFVLREFERFTKSHAITIPLPEEGESAPRLIDEDALGDGEILELSRGKKKKLAILLPLLVLFKFFKIKIILIPILLGILAIKKILAIAAIFLPGLIGVLKICKPQLSQGWSSPPTGHEYYGGNEHTAGGYGKEHYSRRTWDPQQLAYKGYYATGS